MRHVPKIGMTMFVVAIAATAIIAGCAQTPLSTEVSTSGIRAAEEVGAASVPQAALHLQMAKEELELAKGLFAKGEKDAAASMLLRAESDSELAVMLSHEDNEKADAKAAVEKVQKLRQDNL